MAELTDDTATAHYRCMPQPRRTKGYALNRDERLLATTLRKLLGREADEGWSPHNFYGVRLIGKRIETNGELQLTIGIGLRAWGDGPLGLPRCDGCGSVIPVGRRKDAKYCSMSCRQRVWQRKYRRRKSEQRRRNQDLKLVRIAPPEPDEATEA